MICAVTRGFLTLTSFLRADDLRILPFRGFRVLGFRVLGFRV